MMVSCDESRVYETNVTLGDQLWIHDSLLTFDLEVNDVKQQYNLLANVQYTSEFRYRNLYMTYVLSDSTGKELEKSLINTLLFTNKLGKPLGRSAIGDLYELQTPLLSNYQFTNRGKYRVSLQQYMRIDSLYNLSGVGVRLEKSIKQE
jgi:gliding motility-associated lipoprotein GldH